MVQSYPECRSNPDCIPQGGGNVVETLFANRREITEEERKGRKEARVTCSVLQFKMAEVEGECVARAAENVETLQSL